MSSQLSRQIGANLKAARLRKHLTQTALGDLVGCDGFQISRWERGRHQPSNEALMALAEALGVDYFDFFREEAAA